MTTADYPVEELPDDNEQFQQHSFNADISVVFTIKDDMEHLPAFLESVRAIEPGEIVAIVSGDQDDPTFRFIVEGNAQPVGPAQLDIIDIVYDKSYVLILV